MIQVCYIPRLHTIYGPCRSRLGFDSYELIEEIYKDTCWPDADYENRPYYEIVEFKD